MAANDQRLIWLDMEMSGLDPEKERILEIAMVVTEPDLTPVAQAPVLVIHQDAAVLDGMDKWNQSTHGKSGLIDKVKASTLTESAAEDILLAFLARMSPATLAPSMVRSSENTTPSYSNRPRRMSVTQRRENPAGSGATWG